MTMSATTLQLKRRPRTGTIGLNLGWLTQVMQQPPEVGKDLLWNELKPLSAATPTVHDKEWLEIIVNWVPENGQLKFTEMAPWLKLASRVAALDDQREGPFTLSSGQADLIFNRLKDERFTLRSLPAALADFCLEFMTAYGKRIDAMSDDALFDG
jgi:hypothetical protein